MSRQARSDRSGAEEPTPWGDSPPQEWEGLTPAVEPPPRATPDAAEDAAGTSSTATTSESGPEPKAPAATHRPEVVEETESQHPAPRSEATPRPRALRLRQGLLALTVPLVTLMLGIRAAASSSFLWFEYHRPGFPEDRYGFSTEDRMTYGSHGLGYVTNLAPPRFLEDVTLPDGAHAFTVAEVSHMSDVKHVLLWATAAVLLVLVLALLGARGLRRNAPGAVRGALFVGAWLTVAVIVALLILAGLGWERFFTGFHEVFFPSGNWAFYPSDTLIRLYPDQFWIDAGVLVAAVVVLVVSVLLVSTWPLRFRRERERERRAARDHAVSEEVGERRERGQGATRA